VTTPYANTAIQTAQVALTAGVAVKVGSGASGAPLALRLYWRGISLDTQAQVCLGPLGVTTATGYPMQVGIPEERPYGPAIDIYAICATATTLFVEEVSG
jgi:hypothetical protein